MLKLRTDCVLSRIQFYDFLNIKRDKIAKFKCDDLAQIF
jgi:hypothetical protein